MVNMSCSIYTLTDPRTDAIRYVGVTMFTLRQRLLDHIRKARWGEKTHRAAWIRQLLKLGLKPTINLLEETEDRYRECYWIAKLRAEGCDLVNTTNGGDGFGKMTDDARQRLSERMKGSSPSVETRRKLSIARTGYITPQSTRDKLRSINLGKKYGPLPESVKAKMSAAKLGHSVSEETRSKISMALKGKPTGRKRTHCPQGHPYDGDNLFINARGAQECQICRKARFQANYERRKRLKQ